MFLIGWSDYFLCFLFHTWTGNGFARLPSNAGSHDGSLFVMRTRRWMAFFLFNAFAYDEGTSHTA